MSVSFLFAMDRQNAIGIDNKLPWHLPADLKFFKKMTTGHSVLMGRKTYDSIGRPLPNRNNIVLTRQPDYKLEGCEVVHSVEEALAGFQEEEVFVIGGTEVFKLFWPYADKLYVTFIDDIFEADTYFPVIEPQEWSLVSEEQGIKDEKNPYDYYFRTYERTGK
ncbi:dihydrofolate reductase [Paenibacillus lutrae]|uniref:Dihydrofolate reductase n=1 Tax=Paenibacillus lutrae TaxID=2078573 RepID=A0A7X3JYF0_9BACL|nr:dihydrofolate reductase [Paenibacillus lutrae]MVO98912.1 dihydrofolate reductase [Paenibacillus lutrae]